MFHGMLKLTTIFAVFLFVFGLAFGEAGAGDDGFYLLEKQIYTLINAVRINPLQTAESMGIDIDQVLIDRPELSDIIKNGLPPFEFNGRLHQSAMMHTKEMIEYEYYGSDSPDGKGFAERIEACGYNSIDTAEALGILAFYNFVNHEEAIQQIFERMSLKELAPGAELNILSPVFNDVGVGFGAGRVMADEELYNAYFVTCDFGVTEVNSAELEFLGMINHARANPAAVAISMGIDPNSVVADFPEMREILANGLPPYAYEKNLYNSASMHAGDMIENQFNAHISSDGRTFAQRMEAVGYEASASGELLRMYVPVEKTSLLDATVAHFEMLLRRELEGYPERFILNPDYQEAGVSLLETELGENTDGETYHGFQLVGVFGSSLIEKQAVLKGRVVSIATDNSGYVLGNGVSGVVVRIENKEAGFIKSFYADLSGGFQVSLDPGVYFVVLPDYEAVDGIWVEMANTNQKIEIQLPNIAYHTDRSGTILFGLTNKGSLSKEQAANECEKGLKL